MPISSRWSRLLVAGALAAGATSLGVTSASASTDSPASNTCASYSEATPIISGDTHTYNGVVVGTNYVTDTSGDSSMFGKYLSTFATFDMAYGRVKGSGTISFHFVFWSFNSNGTCTVATSPQFSSGPTQNTFYEFQDLPATEDAAVGMDVEGQGWVMLILNG